MDSTTVRVDTETHRRLRELAKETGAPILDTVRDAARALERERSFARLRAQLDALRADPAAWAEYEAEIESLPVADGLG